MLIKIPEGGIRRNGISWPAGEMEASGKLARALMAEGATLVSRKGLEGIHPEGLDSEVTSSPKLPAGVESLTPKKGGRGPRKPR